jgi:hypothetical protein
MAEKYGNLPLGQISKLLVSIMGRDVALAIAEEQDIPIIAKDQDTIKDPDRILDRMFGEKSVNFARFKPKEKTSVDELYRAFSEFLKKEYGFPDFVCTLVVLFLKGTFIDALRGNGTQPIGNDAFILLEGGLIPYEMPTSKLALLLLNWSLGYLGIEYKNKDTDAFKKSILRLLDDTYQIVFDEIVIKTAKNKEDFYEQLEAFYDEKYLKSEKLPDFKQAIKRYCKGSYDIPWKTLKLILDFLLSPEKSEEKLSHRLIGLYLLKNTEVALKEICGIEQKDIYQIKQDVRLWANDELPSEPQSESQCFLMNAGKYNPSDLSELQRDFIDPDFQEQITAIQKCFAYLHGVNPIKIDMANRLIQEMETEDFQHCGIFFASWAKARLSVLSCRFDDSEEDKNLQKQALENYHTAFDKGRNFAGAYLKSFLKECIATTVYFNRKETKKIPEVIDDDKEDKAPITIYAKQYYEYGYALNLFDKKSSKVFFLHFHAKAHFWNVFPVSAFVYNEDAWRYKFAEEMLNARWFYHFFENIYDQKIINDSFESIKHTKILRNKSNDSINDRMDLFPGHDIQYTPLSIALMTRQPDIAEKYLVDFANTLDETKINTDGSTALLEAISQFKLIKFLDRRDDDALLQAQKYKEIILKLIKRSPVDSLYAETVTNNISVLEEAINAFDIEIIKAIVEKKGFDIQEIKISVDELSPLYYTVQRLKFVNDALSNGYIDSTNGNINLEKINVPGMSSGDKQLFLEKMKSDPLYKITEQLSLHQFIGVKSIWEQELQEIKEIIKYIIDKIYDVDAFAKESPDGGYTTTLSLAIECDFDDICRLLIEKGANPARVFRNNGKLYDSYLFRAVWCRSWETLKILLTIFKEKIKPIINERYREECHTAAHLLFKVDYGNSIYKYTVNNENFKFIGQFIPLFRDAGAEFDIPDFKNITVRQILKKNNLEALIKY